VALDRLDAPGDTGATSVSFTVAVAVIMGIIATYALALCAAAWAQSRLASAPDHPTRAPWLRSMRDTPQRPGDKLRPLERVFVTTTLIVSAVFWVWFLFIAGSPLPNQ
jgi:hypothetical protein